MRRGTALPLIANAVLIAATVLVLTWAVSDHREEIRSTTLTESRFATTEWRLLRSYKEDTDRELQEKEQEIAYLRRRYLRALKQEGGETERQQLEDDLQAALEERNQILSTDADRSLTLLQEKLTTTEQDPSDEDAGLIEVEFPAEQPNALQEHIEELEAVAEENRRQAESLEDTLTEMQEAYTELEAQQQRLREEAQSATGALDRVESTASEELPPDTAPTSAQEMVDLVNTRALVRAIVDSPPVRAEYPDLPEQMERYFEAFGRQRRLQGRQETYAAASDALETLAREIGVELNTSSPGNTAQGYMARAVSLVEHALSIGSPPRR